MATIMRKKQHAHRKANGIELNATTLMLLAGAGVAAYFLFIKKSDATETPDAPVTDDPIAAKAQADAAAAAAVAAAAAAPGDAAAAQAAIDATAAAQAASPAAVAAANLAAYTGSTTFGRGGHAYSAAEIQARANLQANARLGIIGNANYTGRTVETPSADLVAQRAAYAAQQAARFAAGPTGLGNISFRSDVPGGILQVNGASTDITVPTSGSYTHALPAPTTYKFGVRWPDGKLYEVSVGLNIGTNGTRIMNPPGYVAQSYYQKVIGTSTDTGKIAKLTLLDEALAAARAKQWGLAVQKYGALINTYPGTPEAKAAQVSKSIIELNLRTGRSVEGVK